MNLSDMTVYELLDEETNARDKVAQNPAGSNAARVADRRIDRVLAELRKRCSPHDAVLLLVGALMLVGCGGSVEPRELKDDFANCYVEPQETRCGDRPQPVYCYEPQTRPWAKACDSKALDTGTNVGTEWCCNFDMAINGTQP